MSNVKQESLANVKGTCDSSACMKPHCKQNLTQPIPTIDIQHDD